MADLLKERLKNLTPGAVLTGFFALLVSIFLIGMPKYTDDYWFMRQLAPWFSGQGIFVPEDGGNILKAGVPWDLIQDAWRERYMTDNLRFGNLIVFFFLLLPKWVGSGLIALCWLYTMCGVFKLSGVKWRNTWTILITIVLWGLLMPWRCHMGSLVFQFNYFPPLALSVCFISLLKQQGGYSFWRCVGIVTVSFLLGGWQESVSVPVFSGLIMIILLFKKYRQGRYFLSCIGLLAGIIWILSSPGHQNRIYSALYRLNFCNDPATIVLTLIRTSVFWVMAVWYLFKYWRNRKKGVKSETDVIFMIISGFVSFIVMLTTIRDMRAGIWATFAGIWGITILLNEYFYNRSSVSKTVRGTVVVGVAFVLIHWSAVDYEVLKIRTNFINGLREFVSNPKETCFMKFTTRRDLPLVCLNMPDAGFYFGGWNFTNDYYEATDLGPLHMIPEELRFVESCKGRKIPGTSPLFEYKGRIYYSGSFKASNADCPYKIDYGYGTKRVMAFERSFVSEADGRVYTYVCFYEKVFDNWVYDIKSIDNDSND